MYIKDTAIPATISYLIVRTCVAIQELPAHDSYIKLT